MTSAEPTGGRRVWDTQWKALLSVAQTAPWAAEAGDTPRILDLPARRRATPADAQHTRSARTQVIDGELNLVEFPPIAPTNVMSSTERSTDSSFAKALRA